MMRITPPAGAQWGAIWSAQLSQVLYHAATNRGGATDKPVEAVPPAEQPTKLTPTGSHSIDIRV